MEARKALIPVLAMLVCVLALAAVPAGAAPALSSGAFTRSISSGGTTSFQPAASAGADGVQWPELAGAESGEGGPAPYAGAIVNRSQSGGTSHGASARSGKQAKSNPELNLSFDGLNHRQNRLASGGNQFSLEPPDQGLCAGNGYVLESVNDVMRVFDTSGNARSAPIALNQFYGYAPAINRSTGVRGPFVTDPSCYYDTDLQRWYHVVLTLDTTARGALTGPNHLDIAVSQTADPTGAWAIYRVPVQDDGTDGTPNHGCSRGPCIGDYPHIGADANGFYITTNEYSLFGPEYKSAQVYAFSKRALASGGATIAVTQFDTAGAVHGQPGFTVWPATSPGGAYEAGAGGTEYFLSSNAADEATCPAACSGPGTSSELVVWALTNTSSLNRSPDLVLSSAVVGVGQYGIPPKSDQKAGDFPLGQCLNDSACSTFLNGEPDPFAPEVISHLDSNDTRMQQVTFANGKLWGALDTALTLDGVNKAGVEWFIVKPSVGSGLAASVAMQGYLGLANNNLTYPAIGVTPSGRGVMAFTVAGADYFPSAGYAAIDASVGVGDVHVAADGRGPADGFSGYTYYADHPSPARPRWGDYGATAVVGNSIWIASEYIHSACTLAQYESAPFGSCGGTRTSLANWGTRISKVTP